MERPERERRKIGRGKRYKPSSKVWKSTAFEGLEEKYCHHRILYPAKIFQKPKWNKKSQVPRLFLASRPTTQERKFWGQRKQDSNTFTHHTRLVHSLTALDFNPGSATVWSWVSHYLLWGSESLSVQSGKKCLPHRSAMNTMRGVKSYPSG